MHQLGTHIFFFEWFEDHFLNTKEIFVLDKQYKWKLDDGQVIEFNHPTLRKIKISHRDREIPTSPFNTRRKDVFKEMLSFVTRVFGNLY